MDQRINQEIRAERLNAATYPVRGLEGSCAAIGSPHDDGGPRQHENRSVFMFWKPGYPRSMTTQAKPSPRERLLEAAAALTYQNGVGIGIEALCKAAGVSPVRAATR